MLHFVDIYVFWYFLFDIKENVTIVVSLISIHKNIDFFVPSCCVNIDNSYIQSSALDCTID